MKLKIYFLLFMLLSLCLNTYSQVTIGSSEKPVGGALLDLKQEENNTGGATASKGLGMPRVELTNLIPSTPTELSKSIGGTGEWDLETHVGLVVYNINENVCAYPTSIFQGIYVWDGSKWQLLGEKAENLRTVGPAETSGNNIWGKNVVFHQKKDGVYEAFISADFGDAGRWMTTNLAAWAYDTDLAQDVYHTGGRLLSGPHGNLENGDRPFNTAYWAYPKTRAGVTPGEAASIEYTTNPYLGLLYTWDAATAGKGMASGRENADNPDGTNVAKDESGMPEWDGTGSQPTDTEKRRQGICPKGWHLPSDYEWTELEQEIIKNTSRYAEMNDINNADPTDGGKVFQPAPGTDSPFGSYRGTTHGQAMKSTCPPPSGTYNTNGKSFYSHKNGTDILLTGYVYDGEADEYSIEAHLWSASSKNSSGAVLRTFSYNNAAVRRAPGGRNLLISVRCKKD